MDTSWTFRSTGPAGTGRAPVPLLSVDYALPLDAANKPADGTATFTVRQAHGVPAQKVTSFELWTSVDDGATWRPVPRAPAARDAFAAHLPKPAAGQAVSLRVKATAAAAAESSRPSSAPTRPDSPAASSRGRSVTESRCRTGPVHQHVSVPTMPHADVMAVGVRAVLPGRRPSMLSGVVESNAFTPAR